MIPHIVLLSPVVVSVGISSTRYNVFQCFQCLHLLSPNTLIHWIKVYFFMHIWLLCCCTSIHSCSEKGKIILLPFMAITHSLLIYALLANTSASLVPHCLYCVASPVLCKILTFVSEHPVMLLPVCLLWMCILVYSLMRCMFMFIPVISGPCFLYGCFGITSPLHIDLGKACTKTILCW